MDGRQVFGRLSPQQITQALAPFITEERKSKIERILNRRTRHVVTVLDRIYDQGNINAVFRTAESMGYFETHIIESESTKIANRVAQGADKWLDIFRWKSPADCLEHLKKQGYVIAATDLNTETQIDDLDPSQKLAIVFGNEKEGCSEEILKSADIRFKFPMNGFSQSFNISVAAAVCLTHIKLKADEKKSRMSEELKDHLRAKYYFKSSEHAEKILNAIEKSELN